MGHLIRTGLGQSLDGDATLLGFGTIERSAFAELVRRSSAAANRKVFALDPAASHSQSNVVAQGRE